MLQSLIDIVTFLLEAAIVVIAILIIAAGLISIATKSKQKSKLQTQSLNEYFQQLSKQIHSKTLDKKSFKNLRKSLKKQQKNESDTEKPNIFLIDFTGDIQASAVSSLREMINAILLSANPGDEVVLRLESPGGVVHGYGLAASQLERLKKAELKLTVTIDKVAASGGYLMACVADRIIAAPFAVVGSIGVLAQIPNFHRFLKERDIDFEQIQAGEYKRTLSLFGENTEENRQKMQQDIEKTHELFKQFVTDKRPQLPIQDVATGEHWFATDTLDKKLVDDIMTSDDYLLQHYPQANILHISYPKDKTLKDKIKLAAHNSLQAIIYKLKPSYTQDKLNW